MGRNWAKGKAKGKTWAVFREENNNNNNNTFSDPVVLKLGPNPRSYSEFFF